MKMVFDHRTWAAGGVGKFGRGDCHHARVLLVELLVVLTITQWVFRPIEGFPDERTNGSRFSRRGRLQNNRFDNRRAGWMNGSDDKATVRDRISYLGYETSLDFTIQCAAARPLVNIWTQRPSWLWMTMATIADNDLMRRSCAMMKSWSFQNLLVTSLFWNR